MLIHFAEFQCPSAMPTSAISHHSVAVRAICFVVHELTLQHASGSFESW
jgi:hypothetical protein